jgi:hypothetical protein
MSPNTTAKQDTPSNDTVAQSNTRPSNNNQGIRIFDSKTSRPITSLKEISLHHHRPNEPYFVTKIDGHAIIGRKDTKLVVVDFVGKDANGSTRVPVRSPVSGYIEKRSQFYTKPDGSKGGAGYYVNVYDKPAGTPGRKKIASMFHGEEASSLPDGSYIVAGTAVFTQGSTGGSTGPHHHIETVPEVLAEYIRAIQTGDFSKLRNLEINRDKRPGHVHADSTPNVSNGVVQSSNSSTLTTTSSKTVQADLKKVVASMLKNAEQIKSASGIDVTTTKGMGQAMAIYWRVNDLDAKTFKEQFPNISGDDITAALDSASQSNETPSVQTSMNNLEYAA